MFTGIISSAEKILKTAASHGNEVWTIAKPATWKLSIGESVNVNGICSTVIATDDNSLTVEYMPETLRLTTASTQKAGNRVNLERSLTVNDLLSGHIVSGHIETVGTVEGINLDGDSHVLIVHIEERFMKYLIAKGSVALNGISLTVINPHDTVFSVAIIPHTWQNTNLSDLSVGSTVNIEFDMIAKYIEKLLQPHTQDGNA